MSAAKKKKPQLVSELTDAKARSRRFCPTDVAAVNKTNHTPVAILVCRDTIYHRCISGLGSAAFIHVSLAPSSIATFECRTLSANRAGTLLSSKPESLETFSSSAATLYQ